MTATEKTPSPIDDDHKPETAAPSLTKKQQLHAKQLHQTPFPQWQHPTPEEAQQVCDLLASVHGMPERPKVLVDRPGMPAGCGNVPSVLDALVRTILSANTTSKNSTAAKVSMDEAYGRANYRAVLEGGAAKLEDVIRCGGLAQNKSKAIVAILSRLEDRNVNQKGLKPGEGELSLDWLHELSDEDAMMELISYDSVGIKTASCVLLFCLGRDSFAVDTHVWRISQSLGWLPANGSVYSQEDPPKRIKQTTNPPSRDQTFYHLDYLLPNHLKYPLHSLLVRHGRGCVRCAANGVTTQDFVETCPIDHIVRRKKGKYTSPSKKKVVKTEDGETVGHVKEADEGEEHDGGDAKFEPLKDAPDGVVDSLGSKKGQGIKLEDASGMPHDPAVKEEEAEGDGPATPTKRRGRAAATANGVSKRPRRSTRAARPVKGESESESSEAGDASDSAASEYGDEEDQKPKQRATRGKASPAKPKAASAMKSSKPAVQKKPAAKKGKSAASVSRDEAEMGGQVYTMHGLERLALYLRNNAILRLCIKVHMPATIAIAHETSIGRAAGPTDLVAELEPVTDGQSAFACETWHCDWFF